MALLYALVFPYMAVDRLSALRGLLAFVAFTELTAFVRCFFAFAGDDLLGLTYVGHRLFSLPDLSPEARQVLSHSFGAWCLLNSLVLGHLAVFAHYRPLVSLAASAVTLKLGFLLVHSFGFGYIGADQVCTLVLFLTCAYYKKMPSVIRSRI